jgi:hypothetical protein
MQSIKPWPSKTKQNTNKKPIPMKKISRRVVMVILVTAMAMGCEDKNNTNNTEEPEEQEKAAKIIYLHHSTGKVVWDGKKNLLEKLGLEDNESAIPKYLKQHNEQNATNHEITAREFPANEPYGWQNYPYDYYNIWVKNGNDDYYMQEPTLKVLTRDYDVIVFKHCFPVSKMVQGNPPGDPDSPVKSDVNYKVQYERLKEKMLEYSQTLFLLWTGPALVEYQTNQQEATLTNEFYDWVENEWDEPGDNIFLWDFRTLETEGGLYLKLKYAVGSNNSHPTYDFGEDAAELFVQRLTDVIENDGSHTHLTGEKIKK